ncbi:MAG: hypothetical protein AB1641_22600 [Thermodesulfobacteriota bacterium]
MPFFKTLNNNIKYDIWGNYLMSRQLGALPAYGFLARKTLALARAILTNKTVKVNDHEFFDTWG